MTISAAPMTDSDASFRRDTTPAIETHRLTHRYQPITRWRTPRPAVNRVSLELEPGQSLAILGPNGGGKTTLLRILATLLRPSDAEAGAAKVLGHDVTREPREVRRQIGMVFQSPSLDPKLTAVENLRHQGHLFGLYGRELTGRIEQWLERFDLAERRDERIERFSGGMRRRVELAKALLHEPRLLLMDEPATGLDPAGRHELWQHLDRLRKQQGVTMALTTHLIDEAERSGQVAILHYGRLRALDTPTDLKQQIGGEVITIEPTPGPGNSAQELASLIDERLGPFDAGQVPKAVGGVVRFEMLGATDMVGSLNEELPGQLRRITVGQPTLEDVFLHLTGATFESDSESASGAEASPG